MTQCIFEISIKVQCRRTKFCKKKVVIISKEFYLPVSFFTPLLTNWNWCYKMGGLNCTFTKIGNSITSTFKFHWVIYILQNKFLMHFFRHQPALIRNVRQNPWFSPLLSLRVKRYVYFLSWCKFGNSVGYYFSPRCTLKTVSKLKPWKKISKLFNSHTPLVHIKSINKKITQIWPPMVWCLSDKFF